MANTAYELLRDERRFCQRALALDARGHNVMPSDPMACRWCASGAIQACYGDEHGQHWKAANDMARDRFAMPLSHVNDRLGWEAVLEVLRDAGV